VCIAEGFTTIHPEAQIFQIPNRAASLKKILFEKSELDLQNWQGLLLRHQVYLFTKAPL
jgi:hypothetical protein